MSTLVRCLVLATGLAAAVAAAPLPVAPAQVKDKAKDTAKADGKLGTVEIYSAKDGYRFRIKDADGKTIAMPTKGYEKKEDVLKALETIKDTLNKAKVTESKDK